MTAVADALEVERVDSHLHPEGSFDIDAHPVPTGREEIWRFTPLKRLRGLHDDAVLGGAGVAAEYDVPEGVVIESLERGDARLGSSGLVPTDRIAARVWQEAGQRYAVTIPADAELDRPVFVTLTGTALEPATASHSVITAGAHSRATVVLRFVGSATLVDNVEIVVGDVERPVRVQVGVDVLHLEGPGQSLSRHPTAPSICSSIRRFSSRAYSIGSSLAIGSTKPRTIIAIASSSAMPRDIR